VTKNIFFKNLFYSRINKAKCGRGVHIDVSRIREVGKIAFKEGGEYGVRNNIHSTLYITDTPSCLVKCTYFQMRYNMLIFVDDSCNIDLLQYITGSQPGRATPVTGRPSMPIDMYICIHGNNKIMVLERLFLPC
jgi:hypothetical protein